MGWEEMRDDRQREQKKDQRHLKRTGRTGGARPTKQLEESVSGLCPGYNTSSRESSKHTVVRNSWKASKARDKSVNQSDVQV